MPTDLQSKIMTLRAPDSTAPAPVLPDYQGACIANVISRVLSAQSHSPATSSSSSTTHDWLPEAAEHADQVVLLVLDGLGWNQLRARSALAPNLSAAAGIDRPITSVAPTTTAAALTSITTGRPPSDHGILGYRLADGDRIMNMLRWTLGADRDARRTVPVAEFQPLAPFPDSVGPVPVVS